MYTVFMGSIDNDRVPQQQYATALEAWECDCVRQRRTGVTLERFIKLLEEYGAVKMFAATVYVGEKPPDVRWNVHNKQVEDLR